LRTVTSKSAKEGVLLALHAIGGTFDVPFGLSCVVLCLSCCVFLFAGLRPGGGSCRVADGLDDRALCGVVLTGGLAVEITSLSQ
jgi:hypothetical protein